MRTQNKPVLLRYTVYGYGISGPVIAYWYKFLGKKFVGTASKIIIMKLLVQFIFNPNLLVVFFIFLSLMERKPDV